MEKTERDHMLQEICALLGEEGESEFAAEVSDLLAPAAESRLKREPVCLTKGTDARPLWQTQKCPKAP